MRSRTFALGLALFGLLTGCAKPHPVRTEAEALGVARQALAKVDGAAVPLTARREGSTWVVTTPRKYVGVNWGQNVVNIDSRTGKATLSSYQYVEINEEL
jgi:hypothetical protein